MPKYFYVLYYAKEQQFQITVALCFVVDGWYTEG